MRTISPYELAYLSEYVYRDGILPSNHVINIPKAEKWRVKLHEGLGQNNFFCSKFVKVRTGETVIAYKGTSISHIADFGANALHLFARNSSYVDKARKFLHANGNRNTVITRHSLGGFLAITMAYHFTTKVAAFNPPWTIQQGLAMLDRWDAMTSASFASSKIIVYESNTDIITLATKPYKIKLPNVKFIQIGVVGWHNIPPIVAQFAQSRTYAIDWNF